MINDNTRRMTNSEARKHAYAVAPVRAGYLDALAGKPYAPEHERAEPWWQQNYSIGRLIAIELASRGCAAAWPADKILPGHVYMASTLIARSLQPRQDQA